MSFRPGTIELAGSTICLLTASYLCYVDSTSPPLPTFTDLTSLSPSPPQPSLPPKTSSQTSPLPPPHPSPQSRGLTPLYSTLPTLFLVRVAYVPPTSSVGFDGPVALPSLVLNETLDVLDDKVGPGGAYHLCKRCWKNERCGGGRGEEYDVGWVPTRFLLKLDPNGNVIEPPT